MAPVSRPAGAASAGLGALLVKRWSGPADASPCFSMPRAYLYGCRVSVCVCVLDGALVEERWGEGACVCRGSRPARSLSLGVCSLWRVARVRANASGAGPSDGPAQSAPRRRPTPRLWFLLPTRASEPMVTARARARVSCFLIGCRGVVSAADWLVGWPRARAVSVFNKIL